MLALQEASVIGIADEYAQATRRPALVHTAAGLGSALGDLVTAFLNRTPLIVTVGQQTREMLVMEPWLSNIGPENFPKPWVKWAYQPVRPQDVAATFMRAYAAAEQPPAGPSSCRYRWKTGTRLRSAPAARRSTTSCNVWSGCDGAVGTGGHHRTLRIRARRDRQGRCR